MEKNVDLYLKEEAYASANSMMVPKEDIEVLSQLINDDEGVYRVRAGNRVHYLTIPTNVFDDDTMCRPYLLIPKLPNFPDSNWTTMHISRQGDDNRAVIQSTIAHDPLPAIPTTWHPEHIDVLTLKQTERYRSNVHEVLPRGGDSPAVSEIACFEWDIPRIHNETNIYSIISKS